MTDELIFDNLLHWNEPAKSTYAALVALRAISPRIVRNNSGRSMQSSSRPSAAPRNDEKSANVGELFTNVTTPATSGGDTQVFSPALTEIPGGVTAAFGGATKRVHNIPDKFVGDLRVTLRVSA
ncbi:MAG: hypothetical protein AABY01_03645, partial [Nanoarchaeota archaeon]